MFTMSIDMFHQTIGAELLPLPEPESGSPSQKRPEQLEDIGSWAQVLSLKSPIAQELFDGVQRVPNIARGLSLVPHMVRNQIALVEAQYLPTSAIVSTAGTGRSISRPQAEFIASRVSALNECFY